MEGIPLPGEAPPPPAPPQLPIYIPLPASPPDLPPGCDLDDVEITYVSHTKKEKVSYVVYRLFQQADLKQHKFLASGAGELRGRAGGRGEEERVE